MTSFRVSLTNIKIFLTIISNTYERWLGLIVCLRSSPGLFTYGFLSIATFCQFSRNLSDVLRKPLFLKRDNDDLDLSDKKKARVAAASVKLILNMILAVLVQAKLRF